MARYRGVRRGGRPGGYQARHAREGGHHRLGRSGGTPVKSFLDPMRQSLLGTGMLARSFTRGDMWVGNPRPSTSSSVHGRPNPMFMGMFGQWT